MPRSPCCGQPIHKKCEKRFRRTLASYTNACLLCALSFGVKRVVNGKITSVEDDISSVGLLSERLRNFRVSLSRYDAALHFP